MKNEACGVCVCVCRGATSRAMTPGDVTSFGHKDVV